MNWLCFFCLLVLFFPSCTHRQHPSDQNVSDRPSRSSVFMKGLSFFHKGKLNSAREQFEKLNKKDQDFVSGLLEIQKINYSQNKWNRFFGLAGYYRNALLSSDEMSVKNFRQEFLALEILALVRHCRFHESHQIIKWSLKLAKRIKKPSEKIEKTVYFFKLKELIGDKKGGRLKKKRQEHIHFWPLHFEKLKKLDNPKHLRMKVKSQC